MAFVCCRFDSSQQSRADEITASEEPENAQAKDDVEDTKFLMILKEKCCPDNDTSEVAGPDSALDFIENVDADVVGRSDRLALAAAAAVIARIATAWTMVRRIAKSKENGIDCSSTAMPDLEEMEWESIALEEPSGPSTKARGEKLFFSAFRWTRSENLCRKWKGDHPWRGDGDSEERSSRQRRGLARRRPEIVFCLWFCLLLFETGWVNACVHSNSRNFPNMFRCDFALPTCIVCLCTVVEKHGRLVFLRACVCLILLSEQVFSARVYDQIGFCILLNMCVLMHSLWCAEMV